MKLKRKPLLIGFHILVLCLMGLLAVTFCEEIRDVKNGIATALHTEAPAAPSQPPQLHPVSTNGDAWFSQAPLIYHAGGIIEGNSYTNSREALEATLAAGNHFIEIDFNYTADDHLVCIHDWSDAYPGQEPLTLDAFRGMQIQGKFTPMTAEDLLTIMRENPQMHLVTDTKRSLYRVMTDLTALAGNDPDLLDRFVIQVYREGEKAHIQQLYPFADAQFLFTIYAWGPWSLEAARVCNDENISVLTVPYGTMPEEDAVLLDQLGFTVYEHTVNRADLARAALDRGIHSFYTDCLQPEDLLAP